MIILEITEEANESEWVAPYFAQTNPKTNQLRFLNDFRNLNNQLKYKPYPMPNINERLLKSVSLKYATSLNLNMGYDQI